MSTTLKMSTTLEYEQDLSLNYGMPSDYWQLLKPRVMSLVIFTASVGFMISETHLHPFLILISLLSIAVGAGASGALNMWYDADIDCVMKRTQNRPIPAGKVSPTSARDFGLFLSCFSVLTLWLTSNFLAATLLAFTIFFYVVVYTMWLKRLTPQNIVIGGLAGALPPVVASAAATGTITLSSIILCGIIFLWTPAHFWALALVKKVDYQVCNIPMMPNIKGDKRTIFEILVYASIVFIFSFLPVIFDFADVIYFTVAIGLGGYYVLTCINIYMKFETDVYHKACMHSFFVSILYLFSLFLAIFVEQIIDLNIL